MQKLSLNILVSYAYIHDQLDTLSKAKNKYGDALNIIVDSGAFTMKNTNKIITVDEYSNFIKSLPFDTNFYIALDEMNNPKQTKINYYKMLDLGLKPGAVFTLGEDYKMIDEYYKTSDIIFIGGNPQSAVKKLQYNNKVIKIANGRKTHVLGMCSIPSLSILKPFSADCSNPSYFWRYGDIEIFLGNSDKKTTTISRRDFIKKPSKHITTALRRVGLSNPAKLANSSMWTYNAEMIRDDIHISTNINARAKIMQTIFAKRKIGVNLYMATAENSILTALVNGFEWILKNRNIWDRWYV